jgi:tRNA-modifying protein YgfZ
MTSLEAFHRAHGAQLAQDGIPLHYGDLSKEYDAAMHGAVLMERSHEGRLIATGRDRLALMNRMSTNELIGLPDHGGCATLFTNANGRVMDRAVVFNSGEQAHILTEPGRGAALQGYIQRNIFFNDDMRIQDWSADTVQLAVHGANAHMVMAALAPSAARLDIFQSMTATIEQTDVFIARMKPLVGSAWVLIIPKSGAQAVTEQVLAQGKAHGLALSGSLTYNVLRIQAGRPGVARELTADYIPLELGLWDEVSFHKGCYTGQEIIARMESRNRVAKTIVRVRLSAPAQAPMELIHDERTSGTLTSAVTTPHGEHIGIAVIKMAIAQPNMQFVVKDSATVATIIELSGVQPPSLREEEDTPSLA